MIQESKSNILLMTKDSTAVNILKAAVNKNSRGGVVTTVCQEISEFTSHLRNMPLQVAVVDIDPDPLRILRDLDTITTMYPETQVVVVSSRFDKELILQAMQSGARDFISKETVSSGLNGVLERLKQDKMCLAEQKKQQSSLKNNMNKV